MRVERVHTEAGSHIDPPLDEKWPEIEQLRWIAAVATVDCGDLVRVEIEQPTSYLAGWLRPARYNVRLLDDAGLISSTGPFSRDAAGTYISGVVTGVDATRWARET